MWRCLMACNYARFSAYLILSVMLISVQMPIATSSSSETQNQMETVEGGRSLLIEEYTATWCPSCAEIDPYLADFANTHGSRIAMVAYHPSDDIDAFQPLAAQNRINRSLITHPDLASTPTFIVENGALRVGLDSWPDVNSDILNEEIKRQSYTRLGLNMQQNEGTWTATAKVIGNETIDDGQLTIMIIQHQKIVPEGFDNPGGNTRDRVLMAIAECDINSSTIISEINLLSAPTTTCVEDFTVTFTPENEFFSVLLIHEPTTSQLENGTIGTFGVVEFQSNSIFTPKSSIDNSIIIFAFIFLGFSLMFKMRKNN